MSLRPSRRALAALLSGMAAAAVLPPAAFARSVRLGGRELWLPDTWAVTQTGASLEASSPDEEIYLVASERAMPVEGIAGVRPSDFIVDDLDDVVIARDALAEHQGRRVRTMSGSGSDEGQAVRFEFRIVETETGIVTVLVYVEADSADTLRGEPVRRILESAAGG